MQEHPCKFWNDQCSLNLFGSRPSLGTCLQACDKYNGPERTKELKSKLLNITIKGEKSKGLGDTFAKGFSAIGINPCGGCEERRIALNKLIPYPQREDGDDSV